MNLATLSQQNEEPVQQGQFDFFKKDRYGIKPFDLLTKKEQFLLLKHKSDQFEDTLVAIKGKQ